MSCNQSFLFITYKKENLYSYRKRYSIGSVREKSFGNEDFGLMGKSSAKNIKKYAAAFFWLSYLAKRVKRECVCECESWVQFNQQLKMSYNMPFQLFDGFFFSLLNRNISNQNAMHSVVILPCF